MGNELSRRSVLKKGTATAGALTLGIGAAAGQGRTGGTMLVDETQVQEGAQFTPSSSFGTFQRAASCQSDNSALKSYQDIDLNYTGGGGALALVRDNKFNKLDTSQTYEIVKSTGCKGSVTHPVSGNPVERISFKPV